MDLSPTTTNRNVWYAGKEGEKKKKRTGEGHPRARSRDSRRPSRKRPPATGGGGREEKVWQARISYTINDHSSGKGWKGREAVATKTPVATNQHNARKAREKKGTGQCLSTNADNLQHPDSSLAHWQKRKKGKKEELSHIAKNLVTRANDSSPRKKKANPMPVRTYGRPDF